MEHSTNSQLHEPEVTRGVMRWIRKQSIYLILLFGVLFLSSGRLDWGMGWFYFTLCAAFVIAQALVLIPRNPALIVERSQRQEGTKSWDTVIASLAVIWLPMAAWILAGLDARFSWSPEISMRVHAGALVTWTVGNALLLWGMASNAFFSETVRIQKDRGHYVSRKGPYQYIRHPGYVGAILFQLATPFLLDSLWALIPSGLSALLFVVRTALEDRTLRRELDGYRQYSEQVRYRLLPGFW